MAQKPPKIRQIVEQERVSEWLEDSGLASLRLDDILGGLADTICKKPEAFAQEKYTKWSRIIVKGFPPDIPFLRIWFTYDDDNVYIEYIEPLDDLGA